MTGVTGAGDATCAVFVAEWIVGDDGGRIRVGDLVDWLVRPPDSDEAVFADLARKAPGIADLPTFVRHAEDPQPPVAIKGRIVTIFALSWEAAPETDPRLRSFRPVEEAWLDVEVDDYLFEIAGTVAPSA